MKNQDASRHSKPVRRGLSLISGSTRIAEMAGQLGFDVVFLDVEHGSICSCEVEKLILAVERGGAQPLVRVPDAERRHVLWALEWGAQIVVAPMVNDAATARQLVEFGKFAPLGSRGFNSLSRAMRYGQGVAAEQFAAANRNTELMVQIETREAAGNIEEICEVEGLSGIFIGPGDLSSSFGCTGDFDDPRLRDAATHCIRHARQKNLNAAMMAPPGVLLQEAIEAGANLIFSNSDIGDLRKHWQAELK